MNIFFIFIIGIVIGVAIGLLISLKRIKQIFKDCIRPDISLLWHKPNEEPQKYPILCQDGWGGTWEQYDLDLNDYPDGWKEFKEVELIVHWAYIEDLLPKNI